MLLLPPLFLMKPRLRTHIQLHGAMRSAVQKAPEAREVWQHEMTWDLLFYRFQVKANGMVQLVLVLSIEYHCSRFKCTVSSTGTSKGRHFQVPMNLSHPLQSQVPGLISLQSKPKVFLLVWSLASVFFCIYLHPKDPSSVTDFSTLVHLRSWPDCLLCH